MARRKTKKVYTYHCSLTDKVYKTTKEASNPEELISVAAYYEMHPDKDDRPEHVKLRLKVEESENEPFN